MIPLTRALYAAGIALGIILLAAVVFAPPLPSSSQIDTSRIVIVEPGTQRIPRLPVTASRLLPFSQQFDWGSRDARQYNYTAPVNLQSSVNPGVFVPFVGAEGRLFVNNVPAGYAEPQPYVGLGTGDHMILVRIPSYYLKSVFNRIDIVTEADSRHVGIRQIYLGDYEVLSASAKRVGTWKMIVQRAGWCCAVIGLFCSLLCILLRRRLWLPLAIAPLALMTLAFGAPGLIPIWTTFAIPAAIGGLLIALALRIGPTRQSAAIFDGLLLAAIVSAIAAAALTFGSVLSPTSTLLIGLANLGQLPLLAVGLPLLLGSDAVELRRELAAARSAATEQAARAQNAEEALQDEIRSRAIVEERQRFVRDMHDGIGGQMQSLLMRLRMRKIAIADVESEVAAGLVDLRLVADSLDHVGNGLADALATFHTRARQQLDAVGIGFIWDQTGDYLLLWLDPRAILNLYRILQEALTNSVRHAQARNVAVTITLSAHSGVLHILFEDDGRGYDIATQASGRGLGNMAERASRLGATLTVASARETGGVKIELAVPIRSDRLS